MAIPLQTSERGLHHCDVEATPAQRAILQALMKEALRLSSARQGMLLSGAEAAASLLKTGLMDAYGTIPSAGPHMALHADAIDEPTDNTSVDMLAALPACDAGFYAEEANVVQPLSKSEVLLREIEARYNFVSGSSSEYARYFRRTDLPRGMWVWARLMK